MNRHNNTKPRPLSFSLARLTSSVAVASALTLAAQAQVTWDGNGAPTPGDGFLWTNPLNWSSDTLPTDFDDVIFANPLATPNTILLNGNRTVNSLAFTQNGYALGDHGTRSTLTNSGGSVNVSPGVLATINANLTGASGLFLQGGGTLFLNNPLNLFTGGIIVDGAGTTLMANSGSLYPQYSGVAGVAVARQDMVGLGFSPVRTVTLQNGGELKLIGSSANPDGGTKNFVLGGGTGAINTAPGYLQLTIDDASQISGAGDLVKNGAGRLAFLSQDYNLTGGVTINAGVFDLNRAVGVTVNTQTQNRFSSFAGLLHTTPNTSTFTLNSGMLMLNAGGGVQLDIAKVVANGGVLATQGGDNEFGTRVGTATELEINGTVKILNRDALGVQTQRFPRLNAKLTGAGTLEILPSTNAGSASRVVLGRPDAGSTFSGTFRLLENAALEQNPRYFAAFVTTQIDAGKTLGTGRVDLAGWGSQLDIRDNGSGSNQLFGTGMASYVVSGATISSDYTSNNILVSATQVGSLPRITVGRNAGTNTGNVFNFGLLTVSGPRLAIEGSNTYAAGFNSASLEADSAIEMRSAPLSLFGGIAENAASRTLTLIKTGLGNAAAQDVTSAGAVSVTNLNISSGTLALRGASGAIGTGFGGAAPVITLNGGTTSGSAGPTFATLHLDSNGTVIGVAAASNSDRIVNSATLNMRGNSVLRLTSLTGVATTETIGITNVSGHALFDVVKTGAPPTPVALTLSAFNLTGTNPTANFTGTTLGIAGSNSSRIVLPGFVPAGGVVPGFMGSQFHSGNEWAKYDATIDFGFELGVTPFVAADYTSVAGPGAPVAGVHTKLTGTPFSLLAANTNTETVNMQMAANQGINLAGFTLTLNQGGILTSATTQGIVDGTANGSVPSGTAGITSSTGQLYVHNNSQLDIRTPVRGAIDFVKSGTATLRMIHQGLGIGGGAAGVTPFAAAPWASTFTGNVVVNDGTLEVHRGEFLNGRPIVLNGGAFFINQPVLIANSGTILPNWGNNVTVNANASLVMDDNGESNDVSAGGDALVPFGSLAINNASTLSFGGFGNGQAPVVALNLTGGEDAYFANGTTISGGKATFNLAVARTATTSSLILGQAVTGDGFDVVAYGTNASTLVLGAGAIDAIPNAYTSAPIVYGGIVRLNKANGTNALVDVAAPEDIVINGGTVAWGPGGHGNLVANNNINLTNNGIQGGLAPTSPATLLGLATGSGQNQIPDTATVTLLSGALGDNDRFNTDKWGTLIQKNGTLNVGLGTMEVDVANITGGGFNLNNGGTFKAGTLNLLSGAYSPGVTTGRPGVPSAVSTLETGAGGLNTTGQNITLGSGSSGNFSGAGGVLKLGGNVTVGSDILLANSYNTGIYVQTGNSFRELGNSRIDLLGGSRSFTIDEDVQFFITAPITNGSLVKLGAGGLALEPYGAGSTLTSVTVGNGALSARGNHALGADGGGSVTVNSGGTLKLESSWDYTGKDFTIAGPGGFVPKSGGVREIGALVSLTGYNRIMGSAAFSLSADATVASDVAQSPSASPVGGLFPYSRSLLSIEVAGGVTGTGTLTLSGAGDGIITNGLKTASGGLRKDGSGRWVLGAAGTYTGATTISAGSLEVRSAAALGSPAVGTTVYGGGSLELAGGFSGFAEPLSLNGIGSSSLSGALVNISGANTLTGPVSLASDATIRSDAGSLALGASATITGTNTALTLSGAGNGSIAGTISLGTPAATDALTKNGTGTWTLSGAAALGGSTRVNAGTLATGASAVLNSTSALNMGGGNIVVGAAAQNVNGLNLSAGGGNINGGVAGLNVGTITNAPGATATFSGLVKATGSSNVNGIVGAFATVGNDWATLDGSSNIVAFTSYVDLVSPAATSTDNSSTGLFRLLTAATTRNSLKITGGAGLDLGANDLILTSGGVLSSNTLPHAIAGTATLAGNTSSDDLVVTVTGAPLEISAPIIGSGSGGLTKTGSGTLILSGSSSFSGPITVNGGTLSIVGPGGTTHPAALGANSFRTMTLNGGALAVVGGDYDPGTGNIQMAIGPAGATFRSELGAQITINDGPAQLSGPGDITYTGGGRYNMSGGTPNFVNFAGNITVDGGILTLSNANAVGGRPEQTITLKANSRLIHNVGQGIGNLGVVNNIVMEDGSELFATGGSRTYTGDFRLSGTTTFGLLETDNPVSERLIALTGRLFGTGITMNVFGIVNNTPLYLQSGSNEITGTINLGANAVLEVRTPGSLGINTGDVTVNLNGTNSRLLLRHFQDGDFRANVVTNANVEINADRVVNYGGGGSQYFGINHLTSNTSGILTFNGGNGFTTRVSGTATLNTNSVLNTINGAGVLFDNGINFAGGANTLDKRGGASIVLHGPANHTGATIIQGGFLILQGANGALPNSNLIDVRGGELRIDNSNATNPNRLNIAGGTELRLGGGTVRITGDVAGLPATVSAVSGTTILVYNPASDTVASAVTLNNFNRALGAVVQFQASDYSGGVGIATLASARVSPRFVIPGQATVTTSTIPGLIGNNNLDFIQYDTTLDAGAPLGVRDMRNVGTVNAPVYNENEAETGWTDTDIARTTAARTLTANRALDALKVEAAVTIDTATFNLRIENGGILAAGNAVTIAGTTGTLTAGASAATAGTAELFLGGNNTLNLNAIVANNTFSGQPVALVKTGTGQLNLGGASANTYTGGTYINSGILNTTVNHSLGAAANPIFLSGGTLQFNIAGGTDANLGGLGQNITVNANSLIIFDNGTGGTDNNHAFGGITIGGPYTLGIRGFDSMDATFTGTHTFAGTPTIDLPQAGSGSNPNTASTATVITLGGAITGSGFYISSSGNTNDTTARLQIGGGAGDAAANTYVGKVTVLIGSNSEDTFVELNKAPGTAAITGDLQMDGGRVVLNADNQIADVSNVTVNWGGLDFSGKNETIASFTQTGGWVRTNFDGVAVSNNVVTISGDYVATGTDDFNAIAPFTSNGLDIGSNSTLAVNGVLRLNGFSRAFVGATASNLIVGGLEMTGTILTESGIGSLIRLNGDVTTFASPNTARLGNTTTLGAQIQLNGTRTFNVADGGAGLDLSVSSALVDSTAPVAAGGLIKTGAGTMQLEGSGTANNYTGPTSINQGPVVLFKGVGVNALGDGSAGNTLTIGDGVGGSQADQVIIRNDQQIADSTNVTIASSGLLDLNRFNTNEIIGNLAGAAGAAITLGPASTLTVTSTIDTIYAGSLNGGGTLMKDGAAALYFDGNSELNVATIIVGAGTLSFDSDVNNANVIVAGVANFGVSQTINDLIIGDGAVVTVGDLPGPPPSPFAGGGVDGLAAGDLVQAVPEPGSAALLFGGMLTMLGFRRRRRD